MKLIKRDKSLSWVSFKYERLQTFCFFYGMLGHSCKFCLKARNAVTPIEQYPYKASLRVGLNREPRAVGQRWLVSVGGVPLDEEVSDVAQGGKGW